MNKQIGKIIALSVSSKKGVKKKNVSRAHFSENFGIDGDAHAGRDHRQVSFLALESFAKIRAQGLDVQPGDFAENITTRGIDWSKVKIGDAIQLGARVVLDVSQIGKVCHKPCSIYHQVGSCIMPSEGIFGVVTKGGEVLVGDALVHNPAKAPLTRR
ncbi:MAG: MOSC domain-containing protein [Candidatus Omnitrophica bacterium]|nr:MOSC domain-containing protein [Candidatus Omnitrophota bacterium]